MVCIGVLELVNYKEWTESLGYDREWLIQITQSSIYKELVNYLKDIGGLALQCRSDYYIVIEPKLNNLNELNRKLVNNLRNKSPVPLRLALICGEDPYIAQHKATQILLKMKNPLKIINEGKVNEVGIVHVDVNNFTQLTMVDNIYNSYIEIVDLIWRLVNQLKNLGVLVQYLGGDNIALIFNPIKVNELVKYLNDIKNIKAGIGISNVPRKAFELATKALDTIRNMRNLKTLVLRENTSFNSYTVS